MTQFIIVAIVAVLALFIILKLLKFSIKTILKIAINGLIGLLIIYVLNFIPAVNIPLTWWSALIVGFLGIPGAIIMLIVSFII